MLKRVFDVSVSIFGLIMLLPVFILISVLVLIKLGPPIFFKQVRPGLYGEPFEIIKFRTMTNKRDEKGKLLPNEQRLTSFGKLLRSTSIDELPELINVVKGDMSLVGPRPLLMDYLKYYNDFQRRRNEVKPGITGWAQVNGRNNISWEEKFELDVWYVDNRTFWLDFRIILITIYKIVKRNDITPQESNFTQRFNGTER